ncbi:hypothetical protein, partial [Burkholderia vietnamiensis]|uniref:hypothetical protein n=1 Tax=Burkholderia vietnamiensis TaxID=60552 RepID=UPI001CF524FC
GLPLISPHFTGVDQSKCDKAWRSAPKIISFRINRLLIGCGVGSTELLRSSSASRRAFSPDETDHRQAPGRTMGATTGNRYDIRLSPGSSMGILDTTLRFP